MKAGNRVYYAIRGTLPYAAPLTVAADARDGDTYISVRADCGELFRVARCELAKEQPYPCAEPSSRAVPRRCGHCGYSRDIHKGERRQ